MEKYSKAVSEMYSQFKKEEAHPMEEYIGKHVNYKGQTREVIGYSYNESDDEPLLIIEGSQTDGWPALESFGFVFKECKYYWYVSINDVID